MSKTTKDFLEKVFIKKQWITREERQMIALECGITPIQVRIWVCFDPKNSIKLEFNTNKVITYIYSS